MTVRTKNRSTQALLHEAATRACESAAWLARYEKTGNAEYRLKATASLMDARELLGRAEVCVVEGLAERSVA